ncbi:MAG: ATP-binding protein [Cyanobacteriota bacterium]
MITVGGSLLRVLVVEDSEDDALLTIRELRRGGYQIHYRRVEDAGSMEAALQEPWDLVLADYTLPQFSALAALALLQSLGIDLPFIVISGTIGEEQAVAAMKMGAHDYLMKGKLARLVPAVEREIRDAAERQRRRQAEAVLQQRERRFRALIENASDLILMVDEADTIRYVSPSLQRLLGYTPNEWLGESLQQWLHPEEGSLLQSVARQALQQPEQSFPLELRLKHQQGHWPTFEAIVKRFQEPKWPVPRRIPWARHDPETLDLSGIVLNARDTSIRQRFEQERRRRKEMELALQRQKELSDLKLRFFSMASHEFRTPLSTILLSAQVLENSDPAWLDEKKARNLRRIQSATQSLTQMLTDVLTIARAEAEQLEAHPIPLDLAQLVAQVVEELNPESDHRLQFHVHPAHLPACLDPKLLRSVLNNLISNAIKYSPDGGPIQVSLTQAGEVATLQVQDQGIGIPLEDQEHLFELFHRASNVGKIEGTGLGLAVVKKCLESMGGAIRIASQPGQGTTVWVRIPLVHPPEMDPQEAAKAL